MALPRQKLAFNKKGKKWGQETIDHYDIISGGSIDSNRNSSYNKRINYDLFNGKFNKEDLEYVCNPLGMGSGEFPATLQHYDISSPTLNLLIGEESKRPDNCVVISESTNDINRKQGQLKQRIITLLQEHLLAEIDPTTIDPNEPLPTPAEVLKYEKHNISDLVESQANKMLKYIKKQLNTKEVFKRGWKDALIAGEEIYWTGVLNNDIAFRRCNPLNISVILDGDSDFIDDAQAVVELRLMTSSSILDEFGDLLEPNDITKLEDFTKRSNVGFGSNLGTNPTFRVDESGSIVDAGIQGMGSYYGSASQDLLRVLRVEWKSYKKLYNLIYTDENGILQEMIVDEIFDVKSFQMVYPDAQVEEFWINEAWEGVKIHDSIYVGIQPKPNQRRHMDNPYFCKLGYTGLIYNAVNSTSVSLIDRIKPYQYLYNIISYRLELTFSRDDGKKAVIDLAQIPRSEGIDLEQWMYYFKSMNIMFINSFEEGRKGASQGKFSAFNQFSSIDLSLANQIQQYIDTLNYIKQQVAFISGVSPQRLGAIDTRELVGNVERSVQQSALITEYLFDSHDEVKRRVYTALVECAKIAFKKGKKAQYVLDDMGIEMLDIDELEFENSELNVYMSNSNKDTAVIQSLKQLSLEALKADKADLSTIIETIINDNPRDISSAIKRGEEAKYMREKEANQAANSIEQEKTKIEEMKIQVEIDENQKTRDLKLYEIDSNNDTKIMVAEINALTSKEGPSDMDGDGIPDPIEVARVSLEQRDLESNLFLEDRKLKQDREKHDKEMTQKDKELKIKKEVEDKKIQAIKEQNKSQEKLALLKAKSDIELANKKLQIEKIKANAAKAKAKSPKKK